MFGNENWILRYRWVEYFIIVVIWRYAFTLIFLLLRNPNLFFHTFLANNYWGSWTTSTIILAYFLFAWNIVQIYLIQWYFVRAFFPLLLNRTFRSLGVRRRVIIICFKLLAVFRFHWLVMDSVNASMSHLLVFILLFFLIFIFYFIFSHRRSSYNLLVTLHL